MFSFSKIFNQNETDFRSFPAKENDFKRLSFLYLFLGVILTLLFSLLFICCDVPILYLYLAISLILIFPIYILFCWYIPYFRNKLFYFFTVHFFTITFIAFIDLVENNFNTVNYLVFFCFFSVSIFLIQRFYFVLIYTLFVITLFLYSFQFINDEQTISKEILVGLIIILSCISLILLYEKDKMINSIFELNNYLFQLNKTDKIDVFLFNIVNDKINILDYNQLNNNSITGKEFNTKNDFAQFFNQKIVKDDIHLISQLNEYQNYNKVIKLQNKIYEFIFSVTNISKQRCFFITVKDVTVRMTEHEELKLSEERYKNLYNENQMGVFTLNKEFQLINFNKIFETIFEDTFKLGESIGESEEMKDLIEIFSRRKEFK